MQVPVLIRGKVVNWIDSKALFGDDVAHEAALKQASQYCNRFGPGAIIYWLGFIDDLADLREDVLVLCGLETDWIIKIDD